jgi:hypothetical protein
MPLQASSVLPHPDSGQNSLGTLANRHTGA